MMAMMMMIPLMIAGGFDGVEPLDKEKCNASFGTPFTGKAIERFHSELKRAKLNPLTITVKWRAYGVAATARKIGCHPNHLSYILHGQRVPNDTLRRRLARLGITTTVDGKEFEEGK